MISRSSHLFWIAKEKLMTFKRMDKQSRETKNFSGCGNSICEIPTEIKDLDGLGQ